MRVIRPGFDSAERADVDNAAGSWTRGHHQLGTLLTAEEHSFQVDVVDGVPVSLGHIERMHSGESRGVVHESVEPSEMIADFRKQALDFRNLREIRTKYRRPAALLRGAAGFGFRALVVNRNTGSLAGETEGDSPANSPMGNLDLPT